MRNLLFIVILLIINSCANIGSLGGGKIDDQPPKIEKSNLSRTNFKSKKIILDFDEYIVPGNPEKNISLQPRHTKMKFVFLGRRLVIILDSSLKENTTYNLIIDKGITDNNANNPFSYATTFSTGNYIDSGHIAVKVSGYKDLKYLKIALSLSNGADSFKNFRTDYIYDVNKTMIQFNGLNNSKYNLWLFTDENNDEKPDAYQPINFIESPKQDSVYELEPKKWNEPFRIKKALCDGTNLKIKYTNCISCTENLNKIFNNLTHHYLYVTPDSALIFTPDTIGLSSKIKQQIEIVPQFNVRKEIKRLVNHSISIIKLKNFYLIRYSKPYYYIEDNSNIYNKEIILKTKQLYSFILFPKNDTSLIPDTFYTKLITISDYRTMAYLNLRIKNNTGKKYDLVILKDNKDYTKTYQITEYENYFEPGFYKIQIYENSVTHIFNPFSLSSYPVKLYEKEISLKANWEEILNVILD